MQPSLFSTQQWTVSRLTNYIRRLVETDVTLQDVTVTGEISNLARPASGHIYFTLKDANASLKCVMWKTSAARLRLALQDGLAVEVHGKVGIYEASGQYQLYVDQVKPVGEGALYQEFMRLKALLEAEGLFDPERKRPIPSLPRRIGIVTSATGAALRDMLNTLRRRLPLAEVILAPSPVQGVEAPPALVNALILLNGQEPDVILVARGGGSIEDLWAFNDERVVRAVASSKAPVICGVGHETDFTLCDFAADLRAPTPTAASELASQTTVNDLRALQVEFESRLWSSMAGRIEDEQGLLDAFAARLLYVSPERRIRSESQRIDGLSRRTLSALNHRIQLQSSRVEGVSQRLQALNPTSILSRGYAIVTRQADGKVISRTAEAQGALTVRVSDGVFEVTVNPQS